MVIPSHQHHALPRLPAGVGVPVADPLAGDPLARGEGDAGGGRVPPATDKGAVHGVAVPQVRQGGEGAGQASGGREYLHTSVHSIILIIATGQEDGCMGRRI